MTDNHLDCSDSLGTKLKKVHFKTNQSTRKGRVNGCGRKQHSFGVDQEISGSKPTSSKVVQKRERQINSLKNGESVPTMLTRRKNKESVSHQDEFEVEAILSHRKVCC